MQISHRSDLFIERCFEGQLRLVASEALIFLQFTEFYQKSLEGFFWKILYFICRTLEFLANLIRLLYRMRITASKM